MEEKKQKLDDLVGLYTSAKITYKEFDEKLKTLYADKEECKSSLKEFDLEAAKAGKPVCTRDGRKARIICFDMKYKMPIVALISNSNSEDIRPYYNDGRCDRDIECCDDLMMLPEKHEGWVNVYKQEDGEIIIGQYPYESEDACRNVARPEDGYIDTIRIEWYE